MSSFDGTAVLSMASTIPAVAANIAATAERLEDLAVSEGVLKKHQSKGVPVGRTRGQRRADAAPIIEEEPKPVEDDDEIDAYLAELRSNLDDKKREEEHLLKEINDILASSSADGASRESRTFERAASRFNNAMVSVESDARRLADSLREVSKLADAISSKVADLDLAKTRVVDCLQLASDMMDLAACSEKVDEAINSEDWATAAELVHRFLTLDKAVFQLRDSSADKEAGQQVRTSYEILEKARERLKIEFSSRMESAIKQGDAGEMQKYLRLLPMIKEHDAGLARFAEFLKKEIARVGLENIKIMNAGGTDDARASVLYADTLYLVYCSLASLLDVHHPIVESAYGPDRVLDLVHMVQGEIDSVVVQVVDAFRSRRKYDEATKQIQRAAMRRGGREEKKEEVGPDPLLLPILLGEVTMMSARTEIYWWQYLKKRIITGTAQPQAPKSPSGLEGDDEEDEVRRAERKVAEEKRAEERVRKLHALLHKSRVGMSMQELLSLYIVMEGYYMEGMIAQAVRDDRREEKGHTWSTSSVVDDTLYVVDKVIRRSLYSASTDTAAAVVNNVVTLLETSFYRALADTIEAGFPSASNYAADMLASVGGVVPTGGASATKQAESKEAYKCAVNNARSAADLIRQLKGKLLHASVADDTGVMIGRTEAEQMKLSSALSQLDDVARKMEQLAQRGCTSVAKVAIRPVIKSSCEQYLELHHQLTPELLAEYEAVDPFIETFCVTIDRTLAPFERSLAAENYQDLLLASTDEVARTLATAVLRCSYNRLGALQLDRELRHLTAYLSGVAGFAAREKCTKLTQIVCILNVETVEEAREVWQAGAGMARALGSNEFKKILARRSDLPKSAVQNMELVT